MIKYNKLSVGLFFMALSFVLTFNGPLARAAECKTKEEKETWTCVLFRAIFSKEKIEGSISPREDEMLSTLKVMDGKSCKGVSPLVCKGIMRANKKFGCEAPDLTIAEVCRCMKGDEVRADFEEASATEFLIGCKEAFAMSQAQNDCLSAVQPKVLPEREEELGRKLAVAARKMPVGQKEAAPNSGLQLRTVAGRSQTPSAMTPKLTPKTPGLRMGMLQKDQEERAKNSEKFEKADFWSCCKTYHLGKERPIEAEDFAGKEMDPFATGSQSPAPGHVVHSKRNYGFDLNVDLTGIGKTGSTFEIPQLGDNEKEKDYFERRLREVKPEGKPLGDVKSLATGGQSVVFKIEDDQGHSQVIKFKSKNPSDKNRFVGTAENLETMANYTKRDLAMGQFLDHAASFYRVDGKQVVSVSKYEVGPKTYKEIKHGILRQKFVPGESAYNIAQLLEKARTPGADQAEARTKVEKSFGTLEEAEKQIRNLEGFYREFNADALKFQHDNSLPLVGGNQVKAVPITVGIDSNHGVNALWHDGWVLIDW